MDDRFVALNLIPQSKSLRARARREPGVVKTPDATVAKSICLLASRANGYGDCSLRNEVARLLGGTGPYLHYGRIAPRSLLKFQPRHPG
jgi:hypothetical protein